MNRYAQIVETPLHQALGIDGPALVAVVGGGGKTTLLFALAREHAALDAGAALLTTTTKFTIPPEGRSIPTLMASSPAARLGAIVKLIAQGERIVVAGSGWGTRGRVQAVEIDWPARALALEGVGLVGVEADGAAGRGFKAPADHEPVIPIGATHVIAAVSVTVLGRPLDDKTVHRPERVIALTGAAIGDPITPELIATVLAHPQGGRKGVPAAARFAVAITQASLNPSGVDAIAKACQGEGVDVVVGFDAKEDLVLSHLD